MELRLNREETKPIKNLEAAFRTIQIRQSKPGLVYTEIFIKLLELLRNPKINKLYKENNFGYL